MRLVLETETAEDTRAAGAQLAGLLRSGDAIVLTGELGAGKTTLVQGIAAGLGAEEHVASPTFTLVREYVTGRLPVAHVDVYRLERMQDVVDLGLDEVTAGDGVLIVEWGDAVEQILPADRITVEMAAADPSGGRDDRRMVVTGKGSWAERWEDLAKAMATWEASG
jgi:tRNA threonylcarbamoyladenosine biosynthesis protein TsaE